MALERPTEPRTRFEEGPSGLTVIIPARRRVLPLVFLSIWLAFWAEGWVSAAREIMVGQTGDGFLIVWILGWTAGGLFAAFSFLWMLAGRELATAEFGAFSLSYSLFGFQRKREYIVADMKRLRVSRGPLHDRFVSNYEWWGWGGGAVAFDYGAKTIRFGVVDEAEAAMIVERLGSRLRIPFSVDAAGDQPQAVSESLLDSGNSGASGFWGQ